MANRTGITKTSVWLPPEVKTVVRQAPAAEGCSMNRWMVRALEIAVGKAESRSLRAGPKAGGSVKRPSRSA